MSEISKKSKVKDTNKRLLEKAIGKLNLDKNKKKKSKKTQ